MPQLRIWGARLLVVGVSPIISFGSRFARNVILSRTLSPDEFGTAVAISVMLGFCDLATDVALDKFVMVNGSEKALRAAQVLSVTRSALLALALVLTAPATAALFGIANFAGSFAVAAGIWAVRGAAHMGIRQIQRYHKYWPESVANLVANLAAVAVLFPAVTVLHDHRAIIVSFATEAIVYVILSHILASTPYQLTSDMPSLYQALSFGLPLTLNGLGLAIIYQLDRMLVGYWFGVTALATYAVILSLSVVPTNLILSVFGNLGLSYLLSGGQELTVRSKRYRLLSGFYSSLALVYAFWMALTLDLLIPLIFGPSFTVSPSAHVLFTVIACLRLLRGGAPTTLLLACGQTRHLAFLNLSAGFGLLIGCACITIWPYLESMLSGIAIGEFITLALFFAVSGTVVIRGSGTLIDLTRALAAPMVVFGVLAWSPAASWEARLIVFGVGLLAVVAKIISELHRNSQFGSPSLIRMSK